MHRLLQRHANEASTPSGTVISPLVTPTSTPTTSTSPPFGSVSTPSSTPAPSSAPASTTILSSTPASTHTPSTPPLFGTVSAPSSTQPPSSAPSSTETPSTPISTEQQDGRIHIKVRENALLPLGKCSTIIKKSFLDKVDENGYKWVTISEEIKQFYWEEFQKKYQWDAVVGDSVVKAAWEQKAKERYRQYIYDISTRNPTREKPCHIEQQVWNSWNAIWNSEEFKKKSEQNKKIDVKVY